MPEISIIVPVYKSEDYLRRCINSILNQSYKDFELILVDDGSPDKCPIICDEYASMDSRIIVLHSINAGQSYARNLGLHIAKGKYIAFVDSDDWILPDYCSYLHELIIRTGADVVSADYAFTQGEDITSYDKIEEIEMVGTDEILSFFLSRDKIHCKNDFPVWTKLYKHELFESIEFPIGKIYEDTIINFKILSECKKYVKSSKIIYAYFQSPQSTTRAKLTKKHLAMIDVSKEMLESGIGSDKIRLLCLRKVAMSYFSILAMYVRYGTELPFDEIKRLILEYKKIKKYFLSTEKRLSIHIISMFICMNIKVLRFFYKNLVN